MQPQLIIVHGTPGSGKTTLSRKLAKDLGLPLISKDDIKELFFDKVGIGDSEWSKMLGRVSADALFLLIEHMLTSDKRCMVESAFWYEFASGKIRDALRAANATCLEIYCHTDPAIRYQRFKARVAKGERHPGHADVVLEENDDQELDERYKPLNLGETIRVDTTSFGESDYHKLLSLLRGRLR